MYVQNTQEANRSGHKFFKFFLNFSVNSQCPTLVDITFMCTAVIKYLYNAWSDPPNKSSVQLAPYEHRAAVLLAAFPTLYFPPRDCSVTASVCFSIPSHF